LSIVIVLTTLETVAPDEPSIWDIETDRIFIGFGSTQPSAVSILPVNFWRLGNDLIASSRSSFIGSLHTMKFGIKLDGMLVKS
jgi:hypothetical protein